MARTSEKLKETCHKQINFATIWKCVLRACVIITIERDILSILRNVTWICLKHAALLLTINLGLITFLHWVASKSRDDSNLCQERMLNLQHYPIFWGPKVDVNDIDLDLRWESSVHPQIHVWRDGWHVLSILHPVAHRYWWCFISMLHTLHW